MVIDMETTTKYFGYDEARILEVFRSSKAHVDSNTKIDGASTLSQLVESSGRLLKENGDFLREIYNCLGESAIFFSFPGYYKRINDSDVRAVLL